MQTKTVLSLLACGALAFPIGCTHPDAHPEDRDMPQGGGSAGAPLTGTNADRATPPGTTTGGTPRPGSAANPAPTTPPPTPNDEPIRSPTLNP